MPNRLIREGILDSDRVATLDPTAEVCYWRMLIAADDAGRLDGRPAILLSRLYPTGAPIAEDVLGGALEACRAAGLLAGWIWDSKPVLQLTRWQKPTPAKRSRFPAPDGSYAIQWREVETRDGTRAFVLTSLAEGLPNPSRTLRQPFGHPSGVFSATRTETETESKTETEAPLSLEVPPQKGSARVAKGFKTWTEAEFRAKAAEANADGFLAAEELEDFIGYWLEPSSSGRFKFTLEKTWDTRRRMQTAKRIVFERRSPGGRPRGGGLGFEDGRKF